MRDRRELLIALRALVEKARREADVVTYALLVAALREVAAG